MSDLFLVEPAEAESMETPLHPTVRYLARLPDFVFKHIVNKIKGGDYYNRVKDWKKSERDIAVKLLGRRTMTATKQELWTKDKHDLARDLFERFDKYRSLVDCEFSDPPNWEADGFYKLTPPLAPGGDAEGHRYTHVTCVLQPDVEVHRSKRGPHRYDAGR